MQNVRNLSRLSLSSLLKLIKQSSTLEGDRALALYLDLQRVPLYCSETSLQQAHAEVLIAQMKVCRDYPLLTQLSQLLERLPRLNKDVTLQELYSESLVILARRDPEVNIHGDYLNKIHALPAFRHSPKVQRATGELFLESIANCNSSAGGHELLRQMRRIPIAETDPRLRQMIARAAQLAGEGGRTPVVKVDLNEKLARPLRALKSAIGMGDYRMRVSLGGSPRYKQVVVRVPALSEKAARRAVSNFILDFMAKEKPLSEDGCEILDVFPPGSTWESGRHPVLHL